MPDSPWVRRVMRLVAVVSKEARDQGHDGWAYSEATRADARESERAARRKLRALLREKEGNR